MPLGTWTAPSTWTPAKTVHVWNGSIWKRAKKMKVWTGSLWKLAWVHPVVDATLSLSKSGVATNEAYDVTLTYPTGFPEGATVTGRFTGYSTGAGALTEGATSISLTGMTHAVAGTYAWYADVATKGGNTTFGPVTQSVAVSSTTVTVTGPAWVLSTKSGAGGSATIAARTYTITLSNPAVVSRLSLQFSDNGGAWTEYAAWNSPAATVNYSITASASSGPWRVRAVATQTNAAVVYSTEVPLSVYVKNLQAYASDTSLSTNQVLTLTAGATGDTGLGYVTGYWDYMVTSEGVWNLNWNPNNPVTWSYGAPIDIQWRWRETYSEGSTIISNVVRTIVSTHYHVTVASGASAATIQNAMNAAKTWWLANKNSAVNFDDENTFACVELVANGTYNLGSTELNPRRGVRLVGGGSAGSRPVVTCGGGHFMRVNDNGGGNYNNPDYDWMVHNLWINCASTSGGFAVVHTKRFQISNCYMYGLGAVKHYIEINSSGNTRVDGTYNARIIGNEFTNATNLSGRRVEDECIQIDYSWNTSSYNTANDGTVTNNVLIDGNYFHDAPRAVGGHHFQTSGGAPDNFHANIKISNNTFVNIDPSQYHSGDSDYATTDPPNSVNSEGAVRAYGWEYVLIHDNVFDSCFQPINIYIPGDCPTGFGDPDYFWIKGNYLRDVVQNRYGIYGTSAHTTVKFRRVLIEENIADQTWDTSPDIYFAGCDDTRGSWSGYSQGCIIRNNVFKPTNMDAATEKAYNKYRGANTSNETGILCTGNTVSDGTVDNS